MDLSNINLNTIITLALAICFAYVGIKFFTNLIGRIICFVVGGLLLIFVLTQFGVTIPILSSVVSYFMDMLKIVFENLKELLAAARG